MVETKAVRKLEFNWKEPNIETIVTMDVTEIQGIIHYINKRVRDLAVEMISPTVLLINEEYYHMLRAYLEGKANISINEQFLTMYSIEKIVHNKLIEGVGVY